ncbi:uncharacterized protein FYW61_017311 isoform 2-T2 [Anableps anableps]
MEKIISLYELLNLSIGSPHRGSVNFSALHTLLLAVLKQLDIREVTTPWIFTPPVDRVPDAPEDVPQEVEMSLPGSDELVLLESAAPNQTDSASAGCGTRGILSRIQTCEDRVAQALKLIEELQQSEDPEMTEQHQVQAAAQRPKKLKDLEQCCHRVDALEKAVNFLDENFQKSLSPEERHQYVTQFQLVRKGVEPEKDQVTSEGPDQPMLVEPTRSPHTDPSSSPLFYEGSAQAASPSSPYISGEDLPSPAPSEADTAEAYSDGSEGGTDSGHPGRTTEPGSVASSIPGHAAVASSIPGHAAVASSIPGHAEVASSIPGHAAVASSIPGHAEVASSIPGHAAVASSIPGHAEVASSIPGHAAVASSIPGHAAVASSIPGHAAVASSIPGHAAVASSIPGHAEVASSIPGHAEVASSIPGHAEVASSIPGHAEVASSIPGPAEVASSVTPGPPPQTSGDPTWTPDIPADVTENQWTSRPVWNHKLAEAVKNIKKLQKKVRQLEDQVKVLEDQKVDPNEQAHLSEPDAQRDPQDASMQATEEQPRALMETVRSNREKLKSLEDTVRNLMSQETRSSSGGASKSQDPGSKLLSQQVSYLRGAVVKLEEEVKNLKVKQAQCDERAADQHLQDQLDSLQGTLEEMITSLISHLSSALQEEDVQDEDVQVEDVQERVETSRSVEVGRKLSLLFQNYEQLVDTVEVLVQQQRQSSGKAGLVEDRELNRNIELVYNVQSAIMELQAQCHGLQETTRNLREDNILKQEHIEELYKTAEELQVKKADKLIVETEMKADKSALETKVSRLQFDSATEQLNSMFHELLSKVTGQEQDWHQVIERLSAEMESKLNRMELDSVKTQLEDRWRSIQKKLQDQSAPKLDDAAGIRKQLVERFHCLSCDRPIMKQIPGPILLTLPSFPVLPPPKSSRPWTLEQIRQHYRSDRSSEWNNTNISPGQRRRGPQHHGLLTQTEPDNQMQETDIIGQDGRIYKGRFTAHQLRNPETKLPTIASREGKVKTKTSILQRSTGSLEANTSPQPLSAKSLQSASSGSGRDLPMSALGCSVSQNSVTQASAEAEGGTEPES